MHLPYSPDWPPVILQFFLVGQKDISNICSSSVLEEEFHRIVSKHGDSVFKIYPGLLHLMKLALRNPKHQLKEQNFRKDLTDLKYARKLLYTNKQFVEIQWLASEIKVIIPVGYDMIINQYLLLFLTENSSK